MENLPCLFRRCHSDREDFQRPFGRPSNQNSRCTTEAEPEEVFSIPEGSTVFGPSAFSSGCKMDPNKVETVRASSE